MLTLYRNVMDHRELLLILVGRNIKIRYKNSALGFFWTLLAPLIMILIYAVFLAVMRFDMDLPMLVTGIIAWQFLGMCLGDSLQAILGNANLVTKTAFPRIILPLATVVANFVNFLLSLVVMLVYLLIVRVDLGALYWLPLVLLTHFALCLGVSLILSSTNVFYRDTEHIVGVLTTAWFFLTPIIYPITMVTGGFNRAVHILFFANPMTGLVTAYRNVFMTSDFVSRGLMALSFAVCWAVLLLGVVCFQKFEKGFGDEL